MPKHPHFLSRVAEREAESWLLGDPHGLRRFLRLRNPFEFANPDALPDPKQVLLKLAMNSPSRNMRESLVWRDKSSGRLCQGPDYNATLAKFVKGDWDICEAQKVCLSLKRLFLALDRLQQDFVP